MPLLGETGNKNSLSLLVQFHSFSTVWIQSNINVAFPEQLFLQRDLPQLDLKDPFAGQAPWEAFKYDINRKDDK